MIFKRQEYKFSKYSFSSQPHDTGNLLGILNVKVGAHVMLMTNIDVCDGLTNGVMGSVLGVVEKRDKNTCDSCEI